MYITHIAIWTRDLEAMKAFYTRYFNGISNEKYINPIKKFESYFIRFDDGAQLELMRKQSVYKPTDSEECLGLTHFAFKLSSKEEVVALTERLRSDGFLIVGEPRTTGDGFFESVVLDVEGNRIELVA
ncbi:VOC family protein [Alistipes sp. ZOR0009]|uniref:VOC family protein n=1 Tax=Alistipes sp. ZOR0009 TaxID=1339253 RepID=UPI00064589D8|nr:VOC family protein [Alistipes sp. ZOR0009]